MRTLDDIYREVLWRTNLITTDFPYVYASGGDYGFLQLFADVYRHLVVEAVYADTDMFLDITEADLTIDVEEYSFPNDLIRLRNLELKMDGTNYAIANLWNPAHFRNAGEQGLVSVASEAHPYFWWLGSINTPSARFRVAPRPRRTVTNGIKRYYDRMPSALFSDKISAAVSTASAVVHFPQQFDFLVPLGCAIEVWGKYGVLDQKAGEVARFQQGIENMKRLAKPRSATGQKRMIDFRELGRGDY